MNDEQKLKDAYKESGVDLKELKEDGEDDKGTKESKVEEKSKTEVKSEEDKAKEDQDLEDDKSKKDDETIVEPRKRSIYDDLKDKKKEVKSEKELRVKAETERDEMAEKLRTLNEAKTTTEKADAQDEIDEFLAGHKEWDKKAINDLVALARKGVKPQEMDASLKKDIEDFKAWKAQNSSIIEKSMYEEEFQKVAPALKEMFPKATADEMNAIKKELDGLSHKPGWNDKSLDYVAFKFKDKLGALVSPKKRGMEGKDKKDVEIDSSEFDPKADLTKMTPAQRADWEKEYRKATKPSTELSSDGKGKKLIL